MEIIPTNSLSFGEFFYNWFSICNSLLDTIDLCTWYGPYTYRKTNWSRNSIAKKLFAYKIPVSSKVHSKKSEIEINLLLLCYRDISIAPKYWLLSGNLDRSLTVSWWRDVLMMNTTKYNGNGHLPLEFLKMKITTLAAEYNMSDVK